MNGSKFTDDQVKNLNKQEKILKHLLVLFLFDTFNEMRVI